MADLLPAQGDKTLKFAKLIACCAVWFALSTSAHAAPWAEPGDTRLRSDIETLKTWGLVSGPVTTWPIPWKQITAQLNRDIGQPLPAYVRMALARVRDKAPSEKDFGGINYAITARATNKAALVRSFGDTAREDIDTEVSAEKLWSSTAARLTVGFQSGDGDDKLTLDGSYLAQSWGNWAFYGGWMDRWWGPGRESALLFSTNARPMPSFGFMRLDPKPFETKWLSWLGPWQVNTFIARQEEDREISNPLIVGVRVSFTPVKNLDIGLTRGIQLCGEGRPCGVSSWTKSVIGFGGVENKITPNDPGNQIAGIDISYSFRVMSDVLVNIYYDGKAEDTKYLLPFQISNLAGVSLTGPWGPDGGQWRMGGEISDTQTYGWLLWSRRVANVMYNHGKYRDGFRYYDRTLGHSLDGDSLLITLSGSYTDPRGREYTLKYHNATINKVGPGPSNRVSSNKESIDVVQAGIKMPTPVGDISLELRHQTDSPNTPGFTDADTQAEIRWSAGF